jgi:hypothetical protein
LDHFIVHEVLRNPSSGELRVVFVNSKDKNMHAVVKFFDPEQKEEATFKVFLGKYEAVRSHWRTLQGVPVSTEFGQNMIRAARATMEHVAKAMLLKGGAS